MSRGDVIERTCDRCAQRAADCMTIDDAYICGECRAEIAADEAGAVALRQQLQGAVEALREINELASKPLTPDEDLYGRVVVIASKSFAALHLRGQ